MSIESVVAIVSDICRRAEEKINPSLENEKALSVVDLSNEISESINLKQSMCYMVLSLYIKERSDISVIMGKHGGIRRLRVDEIKINGEVVKINEEAQEEKVA